jgi:hypothetical protein
MKNPIKIRELIAIFFATIVFTGIMFTTPMLGHAMIVEKGIATIRGLDLPNIVGTPENNIRFALWNGTVWFELPFSLNRANVQKTFSADANGTTIASTVSASSATIVADDVFSVKIPAMVGMNASSSEWWAMALDLGLFNRLSVQLFDGSGYWCMIFVYFEPSGSCLAPDYSSYYTLPLFSSWVNQSQTVQAVGATALAPSDPVAAFHVESFSAPQIAKMVSTSQDPPIYSVKTILEQKFENTQSNPQPTSPFYLPQSGQSLTGVILIIEWNDVGDQYWRFLNAYVNGQTVWTDNNGQGLYIQPGSSSVQKDITNMISWWTPQAGAWVYNTASVVLTTYAGNGYWEVRAYIYVVYTAATHFVSGVSTWTQEYDVQTNTQNTINFPTSLPDSLVDQPSAEMFYIHAKPNNDPYSRYLDLYIDNAFVQRWTISGEVYMSFDVTPYLLGAPSVTIGIQLICGVGTWIIDGNITCLYRPSVAPDVDPYWVSPTNYQTLTSHMGNVYFNYPYAYDYAGSFATETMGSGSNPGPTYTYFTGLTAAYPSDQPYWGADYMQTKIIIIEPDGHTILPVSAYSFFTGFGGSSGGSTYVDSLRNIGVELFTGTSIWLSVSNPELAAFFGLAALITQYAAKPPACQWQRDSTGIEMNYNVAAGQDAASMLLQWSVTWGASGVYTIIIQTTVKMDFGMPTPHATIVFNDSFLQYVPSTGSWPVLTISAPSGGANPPTYPSPNSYTCSYDSSPMVTAYPAVGYYFDHWSLDGTPYSTNPISVTMDADHSLTAYFSCVTLTISASSGGTTNPAPNLYYENYGSSVSVTAIPNSNYALEYWELDVTTYSTSNPITVTMTANHTLTAYFEYYPSGGGGSGCPYVYDWNGSAYVKDNNIMPASEEGNGTVTQDYYLLQQSLVPVFANEQTSCYSLQIGEFESEIDYINQVKLIAVDHPQGTNVAVTPEGEILTYTNPASPISAVDNNGVSELSEIATMNGNVSDLSTYFQGNAGDWLVLDFGNVKGPYANLILRDDMLCDKICLDVQVLNASGLWQTVETLHPRAYWSIEAVNMTAYLPKTGDFKVRLYFTTSHRLDYVGLDTSAPAPVLVSSAPPTLAIHSTMGDVTAKLMYDDTQCVELVNGQYITIWFTLPSQPQHTTRSFILYTDGYYYTITQ